MDTVLFVTILLILYVVGFAFGFFVLGPLVINHFIGKD